MIGAEPKSFAGIKRVKEVLFENKELLNVTNSDDLINNITYICDECGIHVGFSKSAPTTYVKGLSFSMKGQLFIVLTDRFKKIEYIVFAFIHEIGHILKGDITPNSDCVRFIGDIIENEDDIDSFASNFLIPIDNYKFIKDIYNPTFSELFKISKESKCTVGMVVAKIHHDTRDYTKFWQYLNDFKIKNDMFGNC